MRVITNEDELASLKPGTLMVARDGMPMTRTYAGEFAAWLAEETRWTFYDLAELSGRIHGPDAGSDFFPIVLPDEEPLPR